MIDPIPTDLTEQEIFKWNKEVKVEYEPDEDSVVEAISLPRGRYFVGDPCYALDDDAYQELLSCDYGEECDIKGVGRCVYFENTFEGGSDDSIAYTFDSGQIGIICVDNLGIGVLARLRELGNLFEFAWGDHLPADDDEEWESAGSVLVDRQGNIMLGKDWFWHESSEQNATWRSLNGLD